MAPLTVAVTGPTGEIGKAFVRALERSREVGRVVGMARRPFDPAAHGWRKTEYQQGDVLDRERVDALVRGADVVVHLAFVIMGAGEQSHELNVQGSRNVFEAAVAARAKRLVYASSVAAYGFPQLGGELITEDVEARGHERHPYSAQKAEVERVLADALAGGTTQAWVFRRASSRAPTPRCSSTTSPTSAGASACRARSARCSTRCRSSSPCCPTRACPSSSCTTTTSPRRCARASWAAASPAPTTSRARAS